MTPAQTWPAKSPNDIVTYEVDWTSELGLLTPPTSVNITVDGVTLDSSRTLATVTFVTLSGGTSGTVATVSYEVTTQTGVNGAPPETFNQIWSLLIADSVEQQNPSTQTKQTIVEMAFEEIGLAGYEFDATPEETYSALRRLDALMGEWKSPGVGLDIGYNAPTTFGGGLLTDVSGIPDEAINTVVMSLALRIMPAIGKTMSPETKAALTSGFLALKATYSTIPERALQRGTPRGAGNKPWSTWNPYGGYGQ
jgi:hypothetical protein